MQEGCRSAYLGKIFEEVAKQLNVEDNIFDGETTVGRGNRGGVGDEKQTPEQDAEKELSWEASGRARGG